ncbi:MAG: hypothetical protein KZQ66_09915 [Candidatus Thiodiazotropha sp. (ex Lucinoma aequizonata)]|nr:hypothetical protein [Candidatus Thiodiazotropha sp. (ex Lucinoma aequizonata)]MCU7887026.1 hypothetical protein [Candidatus Thiodiazotropha sp. (ex Lucinoma aequizonata)]MCU7893838.1 hypothetical protein [Candidatus Thiodiazotropha sp. (ex Lucinoma aequizonata)]MCU7897500.1 hypothetical protein [Candidatus Thiodiazotropha sp. (ex Lucinoma aequizonata)]MCU7902265.1 hypothetical protein [Candidatus Thiodiazotropha sp. (ex Lucinoma aequizonata)]
MTQFGMPVPETAGPDVLQTFQLSLTFTATQGQAVLKELLVGLDQSTIKGNLEIVDFASPTYLFNLDLDKINLDRYLPPAAERG